MRRIVFLPTKMIWFVGTDRSGLSSGKNGRSGDGWTKRRYFGMYHTSRNTVHYMNVALFKNRFRNLTPDKVVWVKIVHSFTVFCRQFYFYRHGNALIAFSLITSVGTLQMSCRYICLQFLLFPHPQLSNYWLPDCSVYVSTDALFGHHAT